MCSLVSGSILGLEVVEETLEINTTIKIGMNTIKIKTPKIIVDDTIVTLTLDSVGVMRKKYNNHIEIITKWRP